jgi:hypothetical protein
MSWFDENFHWFGPLFGFTVTSLFVGSINGAEDQCDYSNIISRINVPYVIGCELWKPRFK